MHGYYVMIQITIFLKSLDIFWEQVPAVNFNLLFWKLANNENIRNHYFKTKLIFLILQYVRKYLNQNERQRRPRVSTFAGLDVKRARTPTQG
jgi:hypothetical protein